MTFYQSFISAKTEGLSELVPLFSFTTTATIALDLSQKTMKTNGDYNIEKYKLKKNKGKVYVWDPFLTEFD